jgi:penicillin G amidase
MQKIQIGRVPKIVLLSIIGFILLVVLGVAGYYFYITRSPMPNIDGVMKAKGLAGRVEIIRDSCGVPHIYAKNMHDLFFAQGYAHAQDRWWQMEFLRHTCAGKIEELTGKKPNLVAADIYLRSLGLYRVCKREYERFTPDERAVLDAFAEGVNACIGERKPGGLSVNYSILGLTGVKFRIEPWTALDSLAFSKLMAWDLGLSRDPEVIRTKLHTLMGKEMAEKWLVPGWPVKTKPTILLEDDVRAIGMNVASAIRAGCADPRRIAESHIPVIDTAAPDMDWLGGGQEGIGSNSWVATGSMTKSGTALLENDPHLGIQMPSIWYEVALHCDDDGSGRRFDVAGFTFASSPGVVVGHNSDIAWGTTNVYPDVNDLYMIRVNPANPLQYEWNGAWRAMTVRQEEIAFGNGKPSFTVTVRETHMGPIINDNRYDATADKPAGFNNTDPLALHWTALEPGRIANAIIGLDRARNWEEFRAALQNWDVPSQSVIYADARGNIGYQMPGKIPVRPATMNGQVPSPGWSSEYEWRGYIPYDLLPRAYNPARKFIVAANQEVAPPSYYAALNARLGGNANFGSAFCKWNYGYRGERINQLMAKLAPHSIESYRAIAGDNRYLPADEILPFLAGLKFDDPALSRARDWLVAWDRVADEKSPHAALFGCFWMRLTMNLFQDKLGDIAKSDGGDREMRAVALLLNDPSDPWWDDPSTKDKIETRDDLLSRSFREGYAAAVEAMGGHKERWQWGMLHKARFVSNPLGASKIGVLEYIVNGGPVPLGGTGECVNSQMWLASSGTYEARSIPSMRMIVDMGDPGKSVCINSTGQSGHPGNRWYGSMIESWRNSEYHPMPWTREQVEGEAAHRLTLEP